MGKGGKVVEADVVALTEALMTELVKLDAIAAEGEVKAQRRMQVCTYTHAQLIPSPKPLTSPLTTRAEILTESGVDSESSLQEKRVQKYVETLDVIRAKNGAAAAPKASAKADRSLHLPPRPPPVSQRRHFKQQPAPANGKAAVAPTASWETFDLLSSMPSTSSATATTTMAAATTTTPNTSPIPRFDWELF